MKLKNRLNQLIKDYYQNIYANFLGLPDFKQRINQRINEEKDCSHYNSKKNVEIIEKLINYNFKNKKILVVGAGTGVELIRFHKIKADVYALEPDDKAFEILQIKARINNVPQKKIIKAVAENIPFKDRSFDFIYCYTVLEHVQDVKNSIREMIRVTKAGGYIFIACPDYRYPWEGHYKTYLPLFMPRWINKIILKLKGRQTDFFESLQMVNAKQLKNIFRENKLMAMQLIQPKTNNQLASFWQEKFEIEPNQFWLLKI